MTAATVIIIIIIDVTNIILKFTSLLDSKCICTKMPKFPPKLTVRVIIKNPPN